jgi:N-acetylglucosamine kinase-like BadF-type ATPase
MPEKRLILGVDGGGTKTEAMLAELGPDGQPHIIGHGESGASNMRLAGRRQALASLDEAVAAALGGHVADVAVMAMAGSTFADVQEAIRDWVEETAICKQLEITSDAAPVLAAGTPEGWGVALVVGTGSVTIGVGPDGRWITKGGWGHWYGDKGSGYDLGRQALAAISEAEDGMGPETVLSVALRDYFSLENPRLIIQELYRRGNVRAQVAAAAPIVLKAAGEGDIVAIRIVEAAIGELMRLVTAVTCDLELDEPYPLALAGGVVCHHAGYRERLVTGLKAINPPPGPVTPVPQPVTGCIRIGQALLEGEPSPVSWPPQS